MERNLEFLSDLVHHMKYAKYLPEKSRRETFKETVDRNKEMHQQKYPELSDEIESAYEFVYEKKVIPSMRSMQFAGTAIDVNPTRMFNCSYLPVVDWLAFSETMFLLLLLCRNKFIIPVMVCQFREALFYCYGNTNTTR